MTLKDIRKKRNESQKFVADNLKITQEFLSQIENGKKTPGLEVAEKIANYYNLTVDELLVILKEMKK